MERCCTSDKPVYLLYACSGAANTGLLADQVMRLLMKERIGNGTCLAAIGADLSGFLQSARSATENIVIDGCPVACGKKIFENKKLPYRHFVITNYGVEKGKTPVSSELIEDIAYRIKDEIR